MPIRTVVLGRNYTSRLGMIRAAGMAGCGVSVVNTEDGASDAKQYIDAQSRYVKAYYYAPEPDEDALVRTLKEKCGNGGEGKTVVIPTDDYTASVIDRRQAELEDGFLFPNIRHTPGAVVGWMDKGRQKALAEECGLPAAKGWTVLFEGDTYTIPEGITYPCFVKPKTSYNGSKFYMKKCGSREELEAHLAEIAKDRAARGKETDILIEQFLPIDREYDIPGFSDGTEVFLPAVIRKGLIHLGVTGTGTLLPEGQFAGICEKLKQFVLSIGFEGLVDIELYESGGTIYFNELNLRFGASGFAVTGAGINLPEMLIRRLTGTGSGAPAAPDFAGKTFASEKVCYQMYRDKEIDWKTMTGTIRDADFTFISRDGDERPAKLFWKKTNRIRRIRLVKRLLGRG